MLILGLDPGLRLTGYGVIDFAPGRRAALVDAGVLRLDTKLSIPQRLVELETELDSILAEHKIELAGVEKLYAHYKHPTTAILMGHARGVMLLCCARRNVRLSELPANRVKQSVSGFGHASKVQMQRAVQGYFGLAEIPKPPDVADALAIALCAGLTMR